MLINTPVIVLKSFNYNDNSIIARCFSKDKGKISFIVKGVYSKKSSKFAQFQPLNYLDVIYRHNQKRDLQILHKVNFKESWTKITTELTPITLSMTILELTDKSLSFEDPHPNLFKILVKVLRAYNNKDLDPNLLFWFYECSLLKDLGFRPSLENDHLIGMKVVDPNSGIKSNEILSKLLTEDISNLTIQKIEPKDKKIISDYLWGLMCYHFEGMETIKSMNVTRDIMIGIKSFKNK